MYFHFPLRPTPDLAHLKTWLLLLIVGVFIAITTLLVIYPVASLLPYFAEGGMIERASEALWVLGGLIVLGFVKRPLSRRAFIAFVFLGMAAREADLHKAFTQESIFKLRTYTSEGALSLEIILGGIIAAVLIAALIYFVVFIIRGSIKDKGYQQAGYQILLFSLAFLAGIKVLDRIADIAEDWFGYNMTHHEIVGMMLFEEAYEMILPVLFTTGFLCLGRAWVKQ